MQSREVFKLLDYQERGTVISYNTMHVFSVLFCAFTSRELGRPIDIVAL